MPANQSATQHTASAANKTSFPGCYFCMADLPLKYISNRKKSVEEKTVLDV